MDKKQLKSDLKNARLLHETTTASLTHQLSVMTQHAMVGDLRTLLGKVKEGFGGTWARKLFQGFGFGFAHREPPTVKESRLPCGGVPHDGTFAMVCLDRIKIWMKDPANWGKQAEYPSLPLSLIA